VSSTALNSLIDELEDALDEAFTEEEERLTAERDFLLAVVGDEVEIETASTEQAALYLDYLLREYFPVEDE